MLDGTVNALRTLETGERLSWRLRRSRSLGTRGAASSGSSRGFSGIVLPVVGSKVRVTTESVELNAASQLAKPGVLVVDQLRTR